MARNAIHVDAPPERVFEVLSDPACYPRWVVGAGGLRGADGAFPARGSKLRHRLGWGPLQVRDHTEVLDVQPPHRMVLKARARPFGTATVILDVRGEAGGSRVTLVEDPGDPLSALVFNPLTHLLLRTRNAASLRRLKRLAERPPQPRSAAPRPA